MKERPIPFGAPMVRALLAGTKKQTRRVVKLRNGQYMPPSKRKDPNAWMQMLRLCPYGQPGDRLWVREHWRTYASLDDIPPRAIAPGAGVQYEASGSNVIGAESLHGMGKFRPGMFMPRWASRILLEITAVRVERLQDISEADARAEGIAAFDVAFAGDKRRDPLTQQHPTVRFADAFCDLWQSINGEQSWHENPWVWVIEFERVKA